MDDPLRIFLILNKNQGPKKSGQKPRDSESMEGELEPRD
jgi:hypothetical protein